MSETLSTDVGAVLRALAHNRRRHALTCLQRHDTLTLPDLAERVAERETGDPLQELAAEEVTEVYFSLYHRHVPELEEAGLVRYEQDGDLVTCRSGMEGVLERARDELDGLLDVGEPAV